MPRRSHRALVIGFLFLGFALRGSLATAQTTALYFDSQAGDFIGQGQELTYQQGSSMFQVSRNGGGGVTVSVKPPSGLAYWWNLDFSAPASAPLATGSYLAARRYPFTHFVGMSVSGSGHGCNTLTGQFDVLEVSYAPDGSVQRFAADFEQHCDDNVPALFGSVRYNSTIQSLTPFAGAYPDIRLLVTATAHGTVTGNAIACNDTLTDCEQVLTEAAGVALTAAADPGYELVAWTGDCVGGEVALVNVNGRKSCGAVFAPHSPSVARSALSFADPAANPS